MCSDKGCPDRCLPTVRLVQYISVSGYLTDPFLREGQNFLGNWRQLRMRSAPVSKHIQVNRSSILDTFGGQITPDIAIAKITPLDLPYIFHFMCWNKSTSCSPECLITKF